LESVADAPNIDRHKSVTFAVHNSCSFLTGFFDFLHLAAGAGFGTRVIV
jgi:hypothetical protein